MQTVKVSFNVLSSNEILKVLYFAKQNKTMVVDVLYNRKCGFIVP